MTPDDLQDVYKGLILRALLCKECDAVLPVACDDAKAVATLRPVHDDGTHRVYRGDDEVAIWVISDDGRISVPMRHNVILRIAPGLRP